MGLYTLRFWPSETEVELLASKAARDCVSVVLSHPVHGNVYGCPGKSIQRPMMTCLYPLEQRLGLIWGKLVRPGEEFGQGTSCSKVEPAVVKDIHETTIL